VVPWWAVEYSTVYTYMYKYIQCCILRSGLCRETRLLTKRYIPRTRFTVDLGCLNHLVMWDNECSTTLGMAWNMRGS
jgi:hypothetical protein